MPAKRHGRGRRLLKVAATLVVAVAFVAVLAGYLLLANAYMPLTEGSSGGTDASVSGSLYVRSETDTIGSVNLSVYCYVPNVRFAWLISLRNDGPLPVAILGGVPDPGAEAALAGGNTFELVDLASARQPTPTGTPLMSHETTDPRTAPTLPPTTLAGGDELELWARYQDGAMPLPSGTTTSRQSVLVRYSVIGVVRTVEVPLREGVGVEGGVCAARGSR